MWSSRRGSRVVREWSWGGSVGGRPVQWAVVSSVMYAASVEVGPSVLLMWRAVGVPWFGDVAGPVGASSWVWRPSWLVSWLWADAVVCVRWRPSAAVSFVGVAQRRLGCFWWPSEAWLSLVWWGRVAVVGTVRRGGGQSPPATHSGPAFPGIEGAGGLAVEAWEPRRS